MLTDEFRLCAPSLPAACLHSSCIALRDRLCWSTRVTRWILYCLTVRARPKAPWHSWHLCQRPVTCSPVGRAFSVFVFPFLYRLPEEAVKRASTKVECRESEASKSKNKQNEKNSLFRRLSNITHRFYRIERVHATKQLRRHACAKPVPRMRFIFAHMPWSCLIGAYIHSFCFNSLPVCATRSIYTAKQVHSAFTEALTRLIVPVLFVRTWLECRYRLTISNHERIINSRGHLSSLTLSLLRSNLIITNLHVIQK